MRWTIISILSMVVIFQGLCIFMYAYELYNGLTPTPKKDIGMMCLNAAGMGGNVILLRQFIKMK